jgi:hypothetical protein
MLVRCPHLETRTALVVCLLLFSSAAVRAADVPAAAPAAAPDTTAVELPKFQPGLWEYRRTVMRGDTAGPQVTTIRKCADPGADMRQKMADLRKKNCQFAPLRRNQDRYISSWNCPTPGGPMRFRDVLIAKDATSYQNVSQTHSAQRVTEQKIEARRLGECPGLGAGAPLKRTPKPAPHP